MELQLAKGVRDFLPEEKINRQEIIETLKQTFEAYGFNPMETPAIERFDILSSKYAGGAEILKETFKLKDQGGRELGLRYDLTVPFARVVGMNAQLKMPWKRYQIDKVWRDGPMGAGRYREFWQCDIDVVGCKTMLADAEIIAMASEVFDKLGLKVEVNINNRKLLNGILKKIGIMDKREEVILILDKLKKIGKEGVKKELEDNGIKPSTIEKLLEVLTIKGQNKEILNNVKELVTDKEGIEGIEELESLFKFAEIFGTKNIKLDLSLARGLVFYTSTVFEVFLIEDKIKSAVAGGGRYDNIIGQFIGMGKEYPAVGLSFGLDRIYETLKEHGKLKEKKSVVTVYIVPFENLKEAIELAQMIRKENINVDMDLIGKGVSKNLDYADKLKIPYVIFVGEKELKAGKLKLRDMKTGKEELLDEKNLIKSLKQQ